LANLAPLVGDVPEARPAATGAVYIRLMDEVVPVNIGPPPGRAARFGSALRMSVGAVLMLGLGALLMLVVTGSLVLLVLDGVKGAVGSGHLDEPRSGQILQGVFMVATGLVGLVLLAIWVAGFVRRRRIRRNGSRVVGSIVYAKFTADEGSSYWKLDYVYSVSGAVITGSSQRHSKPPVGGEWERGRPVLIAYDPDRPKHSVLL
jgi:hypothetical protein